MIKIRLVDWSKNAETKRKHFITEIQTKTKIFKLILCWCVCVMYVSKLDAIVIVFTVPTIFVIIFIISEI